MFWSATPLALPFQLNALMEWTGSWLNIFRHLGKFYIRLENYGESLHKNYLNQICLYLEPNIRFQQEGEEQDIWRTSSILTPLEMGIQSALDISWAESTIQLRRRQASQQIWSCPDMISGLDFAILPPQLDLHLHQLSIKSLLLPFQAPLVCCGDHWPVCYWSGYFAIGENCTEDLLFLYNRQVYEKSLLCFPAPCWHIFSANI